MISTSIVTEVSNRVTSGLLFDAIYAYIIGSPRWMSSKGQAILKESCNQEIILRGKFDASVVRSAE